MKYQIIFNGYALYGPRSYMQARNEIERTVQIYEGCGHNIARINMVAAPPDAGLGDVRPSSSAPVSFGVRIGPPEGGIYFMAVPVGEK